MFGRQDFQGYTKWKACRHLPFPKFNREFAHGNFGGKGKRDMFLSGVWVFLLGPEQGKQKPTIVTWWNLEILIGSWIKGSWILLIMVYERIPNITGILYHTLHTTKTHVDPQQFVTFSPVNSKHFLLTQVAVSFSEVIDPTRIKGWKVFGSRDLKKKHPANTVDGKKTLAPLGMPQKVLILV